MKKIKITLILLIIVYTVYFSFVSIARHYNLYSGRFDLGNMEQTVWNTSHGRIFQMTNPDTNNPNASRLAFHADFFLILIAPIYKIFPFTETLLIIQTIIVASGAIPVYLITSLILSNYFKKKSQKKLKLFNFFKIFFPALYLMSPIVERANLYDFHSEVPGITFILFTFYFLLTKKTRPFLLFFFLSLITKETVSLVLAAICFWGIIKNINRRLMIVLFLFCLIYFIFIIKIAIPEANDQLSRHFALQHFGDRNQNFSELIINYIKNPVSFFGQLLGKEALEYYLKLLRSVGFLAVFSPLTLILSLPPVLINTLSLDLQFRVINYQYPATIVPGLIISSIYGVKFLLQKSSFKISLSIFFFAIVLIIFFLYDFSPIPFIGKNPNLSFKNPYPAAKRLNYWAKKIPEDKSVSATNNAGSHFARRIELYHFPNQIEGADYIVIAARSWQEWIGNDKRKQIIDELKQNPKFKLIEESQDLWIFKKI